jgi:hypothetical protein
MVVKRDRLVTYGHVGMRFDARDAQLVTDMRARRFQDTFDKLLLRCTKQIQDSVHAGRASCIFVIPDTLYGDITEYAVRDVMAYMLIALRVDRGYTVVQVNYNTMYIRWSRPTPLITPPPAITFPKAAPAKRRNIVPTAQARGSDSIDKLLASLNL